MPIEQRVLENFAIAAAIGSPQKAKGLARQRREAGGLRVSVLS